jgi:phage tail-like protein
MDGDRELRVLADPDQWARCHHQDTVLLPGGGVTLDWVEDGVGDGGLEDATPGGLAFDREGNAYRTRPGDGLLEVVSPDGVRGTGATHLARPTGVAVDDAGRLAVVETGTGLVHVLDLAGRRVLARLPVAHPVDVAAHGTSVWVLTDRPPGLAVVEGHRGPVPRPAPDAPRCGPAEHGPWHPRRLTVGEDGPLVLWTSADPTGSVVTGRDGGVVVEVPGASDVALAPDGSLVVAAGAGRALRRFVRADRASDRWSEHEPLDAPDHDGGAIAVAPNGRVAFTTADGIGWTAGSAARRRTLGTVLSYRLDGGVPRTRWGRVELDACLPRGTEVRIRALTSDDEVVTDPLDPHLPARTHGAVPYPERTPPMPPTDLLGRGGPGRPLFPRPSARDAGDGFVTLEAPVTATPGRYLWLELTLAGTTRSSPRVRAVRVEAPGHDLLRRLPRSWSRDDDAAAFLQRYLAPVEGLLDELDRRAADRVRLVDPATTSSETLDWLAGFAGLVLDRRWPEPARRALVAEAYPLYRRRGTEWALRRILGLYLGRSVVVVERWRLRGLGGAVLGLAPGGPSAPAVTGAARATGTLGRFALGDPEPDGDDAFATSAHRFSVLVPGDLTDEQRDVLAHLVETHKPAHTLGEICELGPGLRVGRMRLGLTSFVGPPSGGDRAVLGRGRAGGLGGPDVLGRPVAGARLGQTSRTGEVRVG